ncbi:hypothetical protein MRB53_031335 [Persea americana]|uniref:Uncharacterized protein n=1 Tax=Persea americana TaxID=3435 RepID=A0ACC2KPM2_PERAE|nr:hypothetical protein MRB53_031335 [Persea americana]
MGNSMGDWPLLRKEMMEQRSGDMLKSNQRPTCSGGFIGVLMEQIVHPVHGQLCFGWTVAQGGSGTGGGDFQAVGPLDMNMKLRNWTCLHKADLLFVDNPVGAGFSYVEDERLVVRTDEEAATDLTTLLKELFNKDKRLQTSPSFIVGGSYGGRFAVTLAVSVLKAIQNRELKLRLGGVALGESWISPEDLSWGPLLKDVPRLDDNGLKESNSLAQSIKQQIQRGLYNDVWDSWFKPKDVITARSNSVDLNDVLLEGNWSNLHSMKAMGLLEGISMKQYSNYQSS